MTHSQIEYYGPCVLVISKCHPRFNRDKFENIIQFEKRFIIKTLDLVINLNLRFFSL